MSEEEKNTYAKQIYDAILGYVDFIAGGSYTYDTIPCEKNNRKFEKVSLRKTKLDKDGNEYEMEENLENIDFPDDINSLKYALNKSSLQKITGNFNIDYTKNLISIEELENFEKIINCKFGEQLKEYLLKYGYMGYKSVEFYGINSKQLEKSDMIKQSLYLHEYFPKTKGLIAFETKNGHDFALVDSKDKMHYYNNITDEMIDVNTKLYDFIFNQFKFIDSES